jgi:glycosyltransferase involved in cell wall biosynthesis
MVIPGRADAAPRTPVRVAHIVTRLALGGADENTLFTVNGLDPARFQTVLVVGSGSDPAMLARVAPHVEVIEVPDLIREISPPRDFRAFFHLRRLLRDGGFGIVHTHMSKAGVLGRLAARSAGVPVVVHTLHGSAFHDHVGPVRYALYWTLEKVTAPMTHRIVSVGDDLRRRYLGAGIGSAAQYRVIRSGMPLRQFEAAADLSFERRQEIRASLGVPPGAPLVGKVARLEEPKGHRFFLQMAERLSEAWPDAHFVAIGTGDLLEALREETRRRGVADRVHFAGYRDDIAEVLAALDVLVLTSLWEGLPRVLVQAAATGVPSVTFDVEGAHEIVRDGQTGYVVPSKNVTVLADRVADLLADPTRARAMGQAGRSMVHDGWTIETMVAEIDALYEELWAQRGVRN